MKTNLTNVLKVYLTGSCNSWTLQNSEQSTAGNMKTEIKFDLKIFIYLYLNVLQM